MRISKKKMLTVLQGIERDGTKECASLLHMGPNPLELGAFHRNSNNFTGYQSYCVMCHRKYRRDWRRAKKFYTVH